MRTLAGICLLPVLVIATGRAQTTMPQESSSVATTALGDEKALDDAVTAELAMALVRGGYDTLPEPPRRVLTFSLVSTAVHNSVIGWTQLTTPVLAYRFNPHWSVDVSVPAFFSVNSYVAHTSKPAPGAGANAFPVTTYSLETMRHLVGDTALATRYTRDFGKAFTYTGSATMSLPTGADSVGLGNGQVTYNFNHRLDYDIKPWLSPFVETGIGDTSSLMDREIQRTYTTVGHIAHFQMGAQVLLPLRTGFTASAYENLPIGDQKIYRQVRKGKTWIQQAVGVSLAEDNGFDTMLDIPLQRNMVISGFYSHSTRLNYDTTGISVTVSIRNPFRRAY